MKRSLTTGILMGLVGLSFSALAESGRYHPNHLFIKMKPGSELVHSSLIKSSKKLFDDLYLVKTTSADQLSAKIAGDNSIEYVEKDFYSGKRVMPKHEELDPQEVALKKMMDFNFDFSRSFNDPSVDRLWAFEEKNGMDVVGAYANLPNYAPKEIIVAVVDTGVDHNHEDLKDVMWTSKEGTHGINTLIRDANGNPTKDTMASHWHGTHVAGTIAATQNNGIGIAGVANNVKIMAIRTVPDNADELDSDIVDAFLYAAKNGAKVINCSFGKKHNEGGMVVRDTINKISKKGVLVVVSAGNDSMGPFSWANNDKDLKYPASFDSDNMIVIASTASSGSMSSFSNIGPTTVDLASPGSNVYSTLNDNKYGMASGTSMAAPNASGVAAMIMGYYPKLSNLEVKRVMMESSTKVSAFNGKIVSGGRVNLKSALEYAAKLNQNKK